MVSNVDSALGLSYRPKTALGLHLNDCSALDHCNQWIFDGAIDLAKASWPLGGKFRSLGGKFPPQKVPG